MGNKFMGKDEEVAQHKLSSVNSQMTPEQERKKELGSAMNNK